MMADAGFVISTLPSAVAGRGDRRRNFPFDGLGIGESCFIPDRWLADNGLKRSAFPSVVCYHGKKTDRRYSLRRGDRGSWVLRVA